MYHEHMHDTSTWCCSLHYCDLQTSMQSLLWVSFEVSFDDASDYLAIGAYVHDIFELIVATSRVKYERRIAASIEANNVIPSQSPTSRFAQAELTGSTWSSSLACHMQLRASGMCRVIYLDQVVSCQTDRHEFGDHRVCRFTSRSTAMTMPSSVQP